MGMSPGQDPPKFHLISVPIVQCKPPALHVLSNELTGRQAGHERSRTLGRLLQSANTEISTVRPRQLDSEEKQKDQKQNCHSSYPTIPQPCIEHVQALLLSRKPTEFNAHYFNTIPLKSSSHRKLMDSNHMEYREQPPPCNTILEPQVFNTTNGDSNSQQQNARDVEVFPNCSGLHNYQEMNFHPHTTNSTTQSQQTPPSMKSTPTLDFSGKHDSQTDTGQSLTNSEPHWMEDYVQKLYNRKNWLAQSLREAEISLKQLLYEEAAITGILPTSQLCNGQTKGRSGSHASLTETNGMTGRSYQDGESRASSLINRLKWRQSRRSKSAHERLPVEFSQTPGNGVLFDSTQPKIRCGTVATDPPSFSTEPNGSITVVRGNDERTDATVPKRLLRWWRQNKRRSVVDTKRRQSMGFMSMHCPDSVSGLPPMEVRTRGSSMPPNEGRANDIRDRERLTGRSSNRSSLRLQHNPVSGGQCIQFPVKYAVLNQNHIRPKFGQSAITGLHPFQPPPYQYIQLFTPNAHNDQNGTDVAEAAILRPTQRIQFYPCHQFTNPTITTNSHNDHAVSSSIPVAFSPYINQGESAIHLCPGRTNPKINQPRSQELTGSAVRGSSRWTTVRCRPLCPVALADRYSSPPPLPPRGTVTTVRVDPGNEAFLASTRHQMQHSRVASNADWMRPGVSLLSEGSTARQGAVQQRITRGDMSKANGHMQIKVQAAARFEPVHARQVGSQQSKRWNATHLTFTPIPQSNPKPEFHRPRFTSLGQPACSRIINGYEVCPQSTVFAPRRVQSATVRTSNWDQAHNATRNPFVEPLWQLCVDSQFHMDDSAINLRSGNGIGKTRRTGSQTFDNPMNKATGCSSNQDLGATGFRPGVTTLDDCNAALRECLRGWELTGDISSNLTPKPDLSQFVTLENNSRSNGQPPSDSTHAMTHVQWTRLGTEPSQQSRSKIYTGPVIRLTDFGLPDTKSNSTKRHL